MSDLKIIRAKPNPPGEDVGDKTIIPLQYQKAGEWFDIKNFSLMSVDLNGIELFTLEYGINGPDWKKVFAFKDGDSIGSRKIIRIHSGSLIPLSELPNDDQGIIEHHDIKIKTIDKHYFMGNGYVLSNSQMDKIAIYDSINKKWLDEVYYEKYPGKDAILERDDDKLIEIETKQVDI